MKFTIVAIAVALAATFGCASESKPSADDAETGVEVNAPGVDVNVDPGKGVEVEAPGVDVEAERTDDGGDVKVDTSTPE